MNPHSILKHLTICFLFCALAFCSAAQSKGTAAKQKSSSKPTTTKYEATLCYDMATEICNLLNIERKAFGLPPLTLDSNITEYAMLRSIELKNSFSHTRPNGEDCFSVFPDDTHKYGMMGENILKGYLTSTAAIDGWLNSPGHRDNCLTRCFRLIGVGAVDRGYFIQLFAASEKDTIYNETYSPQKRLNATATIGITPKTMSRIVSTEKTEWQPQDINDNSSDYDTVHGVFNLGLATQLVDRVNNYRRSKGKPALKIDLALTEAAMLRAAELVNVNSIYDDQDEYHAYFYRPNNSVYNTILPPQKMLLQCIFASTSNASWLESSYTAYKLVADSVTSIGVGCFEIDRTRHWTILLGIGNQPINKRPMGRKNMTVVIGTAPGKETTILQKP